MVGQGSPNIASAIARRESSAFAERLKCAPIAMLVRWIRCASWIVCLFVLSAPAFADPTVHLRVEWGRSVDRPRQWQGAITVDQGLATVVRSLGVEADEPGSTWSDGNRIEIHERSRR